jgi:DNA-binding response OmpR family regulator
VTAVSDVAATRTALGAMPFDFALLDVNLPDGVGTDLLREGPSHRTGVVVMTGQGGVGGRWKRCAWGLELSHQAI